MMTLDDATLLGYLREDAPYGDLTTRSLALKGTRARMTFGARDAMTVCAVEEAARLLTLAGCRVGPSCCSGDRLAAEGPILDAEGTADQVLLGWKVAQTLVEWASGVATATRRLVDAARAANPHVGVACTRKAIPGTRALPAKAILSGGAVLHRTGLSDSVLLFPEHRNLAGTADGLAQQIATLKRHCPERSVVVEVTAIAEALEAERCGADVLQLEKFPPDRVAELVHSLPPGTRTKVIAAGGINAANAADYARSGAEVLVTSAPYYAKPADVKVSITR
jgi:molybdenum transport protein